MLEDWQRRRATRRVKDGDGRPLQRFRWWQTGTRSLLSLHLPPADGGPGTYTVDVRHGGDADDGEVRARLYLDGRHRATSKLPAAFPVPGGAIEVAKSPFGLKRCHYVTDAGTVHQLTPDPRSAEGRRARLDRTSPNLSLWIGRVAVVALLAGLGLNLLQVAEPISRIPPVAASIGAFTSPVHLPVWLNVALGVAAALASMERAFRLQYHWLLDAGGN
ncbi:hypothetical protein [Isoptericola cucumis]|uniref:Ig-like domain-containing protein n=1 Tax=Isoptericola cucumis TaxID=1776856 RepID=A0ABQ2B6X8_9MICO|nr:hypothetical protein [Isoptericola cucumis]GGI09016.1 hypothetical protein GCM10007368_24060 [Isoptericola cucumis]